MRKNEQQPLLLQNVEIMSGSAHGQKGMDLRIEKGKILAMGRDLPSDEARVIDLTGQIVMPGMIDAHSHICLMSEPSTLPGNDNDYNEMGAPITPSMRALDALNPFDYAIEKVRAAGFTTLYTGPGSANLIGGLGIAFKLRGKTADAMAIPGTEQMKMALGENPKRVYGLGQKRSPMTRMGNAAMIREIFRRTQEYAEKCETAEEPSKRPNYDQDLEALLPVIRGEMKVRIHCHQANDITTAIRLCEEFKLDYVLEHVTEGHLIAEFLAEKNPPCVVGPLLIGPMKKELWNISTKNAPILSKAGVRVSLMADTASETCWLPMHVGVMIREGMDPLEALRAVTLYPAEILGIDDRLGSIELGKDADLAIFDGNPFHNMSRCTMTLIDGQILHEA